jgi:hypothetical protein
MTDDERETLLAQFVDAITHAEDAYDESIRVLAAGGVAVTVSIATARHGFSGGGVPAIIALLASLGLTLFSHQASRLDVKHRLKELDEETYNPTIEGWRTRVTVWMNGLAGVALLLGAILLAVFVSGSFK